MEYPFVNAKILLHSINSKGQEILTYELEYPRSIHAELKTHRECSGNSQSSRAVPVKSTLAVNTNPVLPIRWGQNKAGMSDEEIMPEEAQQKAQELWLELARTAQEGSEALAALGLHKQWSNRVTEPYSTIKTVLTATSFDNLFWLRDDATAVQPEFVYLAKLMKKLKEESVPQILKDGEWHLPYVRSMRNRSGKQQFVDSTATKIISVEDALKISASCCGQISYRKLDDSLDKAIDVYSKLFSGPKPHLSPTEHQAKAFTGFDVDTFFAGYYDGITHVFQDCSYGSGNLKNWIQYRHLL